MSTKYDYYDATSGVNGVVTSGVVWYSQTFTASDDYTVTSVYLTIGDVSSLGNVTVSIRASTLQTGYYVPTGGDLGSGTVDCSGVGGFPGSKVEFPISGEIELTSGTKYAIVVRADSGSASIERDNTTSPAYAGGKMNYSADSGSSWTPKPQYDAIFEVWGEAAVTYNVTATIAGSGGITVSDHAVYTAVGVAATIPCLGDIIVSGHGVLTVVGVAATVAGLGDISASALIRSDWQVNTFKTYRRLVVVGSDTIFYEDI